MSFLRLVLLSGLVVVTGTHPIKLETRTTLNSRLANIHLSYELAIEGTVSFTYGSCFASAPNEAHHIIGTAVHGAADRLVWVMPDDVASDGCISAWTDSGLLVGRSEVQSIQAISKRSLRVTRKRSDASVAMTNSSGIDPWGPWFDGVALLEGKRLGSVEAKRAKGKRVGIVGTGMAGLMTFLVLSQAGMTNIEMVEASNRLGGRVHTEYLSGGPFDYSYQEMGPMRFPDTITLSNTTYNVSDHQLVFQLADEMNKINKHDRNLSVDFIPWYQSSPNGLYYYNGIKLAGGLPPSQAQIKANSSLAISSTVDKSTQKLRDIVDSRLPNGEFFVAMAQNMFKAHAEWIENGLDGLPGDQWSEFAYMVNYLQANLNSTDVVGGGNRGGSFWDSLYEGMYFSATTWRTIDGGLNRLPLSFHPLVDNITTLNRTIERVRYSSEDDRVTLQWRHSYTDGEFQNSTYDYAVVAVPFSIVKKWRLPSTLGLTMSNAINHMPYTSACKVALEFKTRFWEHFDQPIYGSCSTESDIPGIGSICYPSYNINGTGPASIIGSYISDGEWGARWVATPEAEHVQYVLDAMVEIHGNVAREGYTGKYNRRCWMLDPYETASWASPSVGQHQLYIPEYFKTHDNLIFVGEHTSYTHAWISSALESGIRGGVQLLLELGLVDEAKETVDKWMARWIDV